MKIGIGLPSAVPGVGRDGIVEWARRSEQAGFSTLATLDRLAYPNLEPITALAAAAAVTGRIGLMTDVLLLPLRSNTALFAKQAATLDVLCEGRLTLGLAPGAREDDFALSGVPMSERGRTIDRQLAQLRELWAGGVGPEPARPGGPRVLVGGSNPWSFRRAARFGDGWTMGGATPEEFEDARGAFEDEWRRQGREGEPDNAVLTYACLGLDAVARAERYIRHYYDWLPPEVGGQIADGVATDAESLGRRIEGFREHGAQEVLVFPCSASLEQVELIAAAAL